MCISFGSVFLELVRYKWAEHVLQFHIWPTDGDTLLWITEPSQSFDVALSEAFKSISGQMSLIMDSTISGSTNLKSPSSVVSKEINLKYIS